MAQRHKSLKMREVVAKDAKAGFSRLLTAVQREPVAIKRNGRAVAVVVSIKDYKRLEAMEDAWWSTRAERSAKGGFLSRRQSAKLLADMMNADN